MKKQIQIITLLMITMLYNLHSSNTWNWPQELLNKVVTTAAISLFISVLDKKFFPEPDPKVIKIKELEAKNQALETELKNLKNKELLNDQKSTEEISLIKKLKSQSAEDKQCDF